MAEPGGDDDGAALDRLRLSGLRAAQRQDERTGLARYPGELGAEPDLDERMGGDHFDHPPDLRLRRFTARSQAGIVLRDRGAAEEVALLDQHNLAADLRDALCRAQPSGAPTDNSNLVRRH